MKKTDNNFKVYVNNNGERVMRVSEVIKTLAKDSIAVWANALGFKGIKYKEELERTANIGSLCHEVIEMYFSKRYLAEVDYDDFNITEYGDKLEVRNALDSFFKWLPNFLKIHDYKIKFTELTVVGENLGGTIDCGIDGWKDPKKVIFVDYKTSKSFFFTQFLQLAAYTMLYEEVYGPNTVEGGMIVRLDKSDKQNAEARYLDRKDMDPFITAFQCLYDVTCGVKMLDTNLWRLTTKM